MMCFEISVDVGVVRTFQILHIKMRYSASVRTSNRTLNAKMRYSGLNRMSKWDFECQNAIFGINSNVKIGF